MKNLMEVNTVEEKQYDEVYEVFDELYSCIEEIVDEYQDPEVRHLVIAKLQEKSREFMYMFEEEIAKLDLVEMVA